MGVAFALGDMLALIHPGTHFVDPGEGYFRDLQAAPIGGVDEVDIPELKAGEDGAADRSNIGVPVVLAAGHVVEGPPSQLWPGGSRVAV